MLSCAEDFCATPDLLCVVLPGELGVDSHSSSEDAVVGLTSSVVFGVTPPLSFGIAAVFGFVSVPPVQRAWLTMKNLKVAL